MGLEVQMEKKFPGFQLNVDFHTEGGCMGILGASGCGKSMTLKCIAGIEKPDKGKIVLNGRILYDSEKKISLSVQERNVGYLFQDYALFPTMTVEQNLAVAMKGKKREKEQKIKEQIRRFRLEGLERRYPSQISGGQQQRVALARMLLHQPEIIMLDEPFSALDGFLKDELQLEMLELLKDYGKDVLMVSHSRDEIFRFCDRLILLEDGKSILKGSTAEQILLSGHSVSVLPGSENVLSESPSFQSASESDCLPGAEDCITNAPALLPDYQIRKQSSPDPALPEVISV